MRNGARLHRVAGELFLQACALEPDERAAFLDRACAGDDELRDEVESLLAHDAEVDPVLDRPALGEGFRVPELEGVASAPADSVPERIGDYRVLGVLGEGGMGVVYLAGQPTTRRLVALKLLRADATSPRMQARFEREAEVLGLLDHPGIARIYEASTVELAGRTRMFIAMELVEGLTLTDHAREHGLGTRERIALLIETCEAVHHANLRGVVHRDLKPENVHVLYTGRVKVLDFGVARLRESDVPFASRWTSDGQLIGTVSAMSPEQTFAGRTDVDLRSDVYSLGVVAYELLGGRRPYDVDGMPLDVALATVREVDPPLLGRVHRELRGDLEAIVAKAMEKDRDRRYASAADLAADLRRHLEGLPIQARPATTMYQLSRFARRRRGLVTGLAAAVLVSIAGFALMTKLMLDARREAERATVMSEFFTEFLRSPNPTRLGRDVTVLEAIEALRSEMPERFADHPDLELDLRATLGGMFMQIDRSDLARPELDRVNEIGPSQGVESFIYGRLADISIDLTAEDGEERARLALDELLRDDGALLKPYPQLHIRALRLAARLARMTEDLAGSRRLLAGALEIASEGGFDKDRYGCLNDLARTAVEEGRLDDAELLARESYRGLVAFLGDTEHRLVAIADVTLAMTILERTKTGETVPPELVAEAIAHATHALEWRRAEFAPEAEGVAVAAELLAGLEAAR